MIKVGDLFDCMVKRIKPTPYVVGEHKRNMENFVEVPDATGVVCFSGGKDSTAMLLRMLELDDPIRYPITRIVFADTGFEFPQLYDYLDRVQAYLDEHYPERGLVIERVAPIGTWDEWFYGNATRGQFEGKPRGAPLKLYPCWWTRQAKLYPLDKIMDAGDITYQYMGIAIDEPKRLQSGVPQVRFPLAEWEWTEADCMAFLDHHGIALELYTVFNRLGCYHCPKQSFRSWYSLWLHFPELYEKAEWWDNESYNIAGHGFTLRDRGETGLAELRVKFKQGYIPKGRMGMECRSCDAITFVNTGVLGFEDFEDGEAIERLPETKNGGKYEHLNEAEKVEWIPPSHANMEHIKAAKFDSWFLPMIDENPTDLLDDEEIDCMDLSQFTDDDN